MNIILKKIYYRLLKKNPADMPMVQYWKTKEAVSAKQTVGKDGNIYMVLEGEKYPFPTYPRAHLLFGPLSKLKHEIKNQVFNDSWAKLEEGVDDEDVIDDIKDTLFVHIPKIAEESRYDMLPPSAMCGPVREIHRAWTKVTKDPRHLELRDYLCFILQEDDAYRMRVQWVAKFARWFNHPKWFRRGLALLEHAEVVGDMKERIRLLRRILLLMLKDERTSKLFVNLFREINWKKVQLSKGDKYHFRGKWFKVDYPEIEY